MTGGAATPTPGEVIAFWREAGPKRWFEKDAGFDEEIRRRFLALHETAAAGKLTDWEASAESALALLILLDQFPRNMFRGSARAFASDALAREAARQALRQGHDRGLLPAERMFLYLPFEHSEALDDQVLCCELMRPLAEFEETKDVYDYAVRHYEIIARFGRFPHRNEALGRASTPEENEFLQQPGSGF